MSFSVHNIPLLLKIVMHFIPVGSAVKAVHTGLVMLDTVILHNCVISAVLSRDASAAL